MFTTFETCLIDVYETVLTVDFVAMSDELAAVAGVSSQVFGAAAGTVGHRLNTGELTMEQGAVQLLRACGVEPRADLVRDLVEADRCLLVSHARLHDDTLAFLAMLKRRGVRSAFVSNSAENTRPLLRHLGLDVLVDAMVLSCEVGCAKPSAAIYLRALQDLDGGPESALFVDDQPDYCRAAAALGITAVQVVREPRSVSGPASGASVVRSLTELDDWF